MTDLAGEDRRRYVTDGAALVGDRRISRGFVPPRDLRRMFEHLIAPDPNALDARDTLAIDAASGLPTLPEFLRARVRMQADDDGPGLERFRVEARVRRARAKTADLKVIVDRFDPANSLFRRAVLELHIDGCGEVALHGDDAELSGRLRDTLFRFATAAPSLLFMRMNDVPGVAVTELTCGTTGPLISRHMHVLQPFAPVIDAHRDAMILICSLARVTPEGERVDPLLFTQRGVVPSLRNAQPGRVIYPVGQA